MLYRASPPPPNLAHIVRAYWMLEGNLPSERPTRYRLLADSCPGFVFYYRNTSWLQWEAGTFRSFKGSILHGQTHRHKETQVQGSYGVFGVYLYPTALPAITGIPSRDLSNTYYELDTILGRDGRWLEEAIHAADTFENRIRLFNTWCMQRMELSASGDKGLDFFIRRMLLSGNLDIDQAISTLTISRRQFERRFLAATGYSPRYYQRLVRFKNVLSATQGSGRQSLTELALAAGYYDQSHFIRDFKEFSGMTPRSYFHELGDVADTLVNLSDKGGSDVRETVTSVIQ